MIKKYKKKPVIIEACVWDGTNKEELISFSKGAVSFLQVQRSDGVVTHCYIKTLEGTMEANVGDYIICGVNGEFYPCKPDIFQKTYEVVEKTPCHSYQIGQRGKYIFNPVTGKNEYTLVSYGFCLGTKECEECSCEGDKSRCDFY